jgi:hypothetical protein
VADTVFNLVDVQLKRNVGRIDLVKNIVKEFESGMSKTVSNGVLHDVMSSYRDGTGKNITATF